MEDNDEVLRLLQSADHRLALLALDQEMSLRTYTLGTPLTSQERARTFNAIDGVRGSSERAAVVGVTERAAEVFVKELLELGLCGKSAARPVGGPSLLSKTSPALLTCT